MTVLNILIMHVLLSCVLQLMETLWGVLASNVALLVNIVVTIISLIFGGGSTLLNILLEAVSVLKVKVRS